MSGARPARPVTRDGLIMSPAMWDVVEDCWKDAPNGRPTADKLANRLGKIVMAEHEKILSSDVQCQPETQPINAGPSRVTSPKLLLEAPHFPDPSHYVDAGAIREAEELLKKLSPRPVGTTKKRRRLF